MPEVIVEVNWAKQERAFYCGPACAEMVLNALGIGRPNTPPSWQDQLWPLVEAATGEARPSGAGPPTPTFLTQLCERCPGAPFTCWSTSPRALTRVLNAQQSVAQYSVTASATEAQATTLLLKTLDAGVPAVALVWGWRHWLVVYGYQHSEPNPWPLPRHNVNGIYLHNPQVPGILFVKAQKWRRKYLKFVPCGQYQNMFVVVH